LPDAGLSGEQQGHGFSLAPDPWTYQIQALQPPHQVAAAPISISRLIQHLLLGHFQVPGRRLRFLHPLLVTVIMNEKLNVPLRTALEWRRSVETRPSFDLPLLRSGA
jgi:hypothetical protein